MSARMSDPLVVTTRDAGSWWKRAVDADGHGLYARAESTDVCPELRSIRELAVYGLTGMLDAVPVPAGVEPQPLSAERLAEIEARANAATAGPWCTDSWEIYQGAEYEPGMSFWIGETCRGTSDLDQDRADAAFVAAARSDVPALVAEIRRLLAERRETNEALDDAVTALRALERKPEADGIARRIAPTQALQPVEDPCHPCGCPKRFDRHAWGCPTLRDEDPFGLHHSYRVSRDLPPLDGPR